MRIRLAIALAVVAFAASAAHAVPTLQLYAPGATYVTENESWLTLDNPFTLELLGAGKNGNTTFIAAPTLHIAIPEDWWEPGTTVTITGPGYESGATITNWQFGQPGVLSAHGIFPAYYASLVLPDMDVANGTDVIPDYNPDGDGQDTGVVYTYDVSYSGAFGIHLDATGRALSKNGKWKDVFAPYSHDVDADPPGGGGIIPEPTTLLLLGLGFLAARRTTRR